MRFCTKSTKPGTPHQGRGVTTPSTLPWRRGGYRRGVQGLVDFVKNPILLICPVLFHLYLKLEFTSSDRVFDRSLQSAVLPKMEINNIIIENIFLWTLSWLTSEFPCIGQGGGGLIWPPSGRNRVKILFSAQTLPELFVKFSIRLGFSFSDHWKDIWP